MAEKKKDRRGLEGGGPKVAGSALASREGERSPSSSDPNSDFSSVDNDSMLTGDIEVHGHRYHASRTIFLPNDETEQRRMRVQHELLKLVLDGSLTATKLPSTLDTIVDVGTGIGVWASEMGAKYPNAKVTGIDISPIQDKMAPANVNFEIENVAKPWHRPPNTADFIHMRNLAGGITDWQSLLAEAHNHLKPGGLLEVTEIRTRFFDFDGPFLEAEICPEFERQFHECAEKVGIDFDPSPKFPLWLNDVGFEKVVQRTEILPLGSWGRDEKMQRRGEIYLNMVNEFSLENYTVLLFTAAGWKINDLYELLERVRRDLSKPNVKVYGTIVFTTARKPK